MPKTCVHRCHIRESVDSLCRDGADTDTPIYQMKRLITPERYSYKPFQTYNKALRVFLYHIRPSKYVKYTYTMTYGNCHTSVFEYFFIIFWTLLCAAVCCAFLFVRLFHPGGTTTLMQVRQFYCSLVSTFIFSHKYRVPPVFVS